MKKNEINQINTAIIDENCVRQDPVLPPASSGSPVSARAKARLWEVRGPLG